MNRRDIFKLFGGAAAIPAVKSVETLEMKSDDVLVVKVQGRISQETANQIQTLCRSKLHGREVIVVDESIDFEVIRTHANVRDEIIPKITEALINNTRDTREKWTKILGGARNSER